MKRALPTLFLTLTFAFASHAADPKLDPTGVWKWTAPANPDGKVPTNTFTLKLQGESVTGTITKSTGARTITNGVFRGDLVSFQVQSEGHSGKSTTTYSGKLTGDTIKGKLQIDVSGKTFSSNWEIKRVKD